MRKIQSILFLKCPRCRKGRLLVGHPYQLRNLNKVNESCTACQLNFKIETGFFYGTMYVSYGLGVALSIKVYIFLSLLGMVDKPLNIFFIICGTLIALMPYINALSKVIWAGLFLKYDPNSLRKKPLINK